MSNSDTILPASSMFHANGWGVPYAAAMMGAKLVFPGPHLDPESLLELIQKENVSLAMAVPTVWFGLLGALEKNPGRWKPSRPLRIMCGGSAVPESLLRGLDRFGIRLIHLWGMTETAPIATLGVMKSTMANLSEDEKYKQRAKQGMPVPFIELRVMTFRRRSALGRRDLRRTRSARALGRRGLFRCARSARPLDSRRMVSHRRRRHIDRDGYIKIVDRSKDLIKSGGEWISSVDLENALMCHPVCSRGSGDRRAASQMAGTPLAVVVAKEGMQPNLDELRHFPCGAFRKMAAAGRFCICERDSAHFGRKVPEAQAPRTVCQLEMGPGLTRAIVKRCCHAERP